MPSLCQSLCVLFINITICVQAFGDILNLVPVSENVTKLTAVCTICFKPAAFTRRKTSEAKVMSFICCWKLLFFFLFLLLLFFCLFHPAQSSMGDLSSLRVLCSRRSLEWINEFSIRAQVSGPMIFLLKSTRNPQLSDLSEQSCTVCPCNGLS